MCLYNSNNLVLFHLCLKISPHSLSHERGGSCWVMHACTHTHRWYTHDVATRH